VKDETMPLFAGCAYVVGQGHKGQKSFKIFCNKLCAPGSSHCPKHDLITEDEGKEPERKRLARKAKRDYRKADIEALASSPLRANNPDAEKTKERIYSEAE